MKTFIKLLFVFMIFGAFQSAIAQSSPKLTLLAKSKVHTATAQIALSSDDESIGQVRIISEQSGKPLNQTHKLSEVVFVTVELEEGVNKFTLLAYDKAGNLNNSAVKSIVITRISASTGENTRAYSESSNTDNAATFPAGNNFQAAPINSNNSTDKKLKLNAEREVKDGNRYTLKIDANGIKDLAGDYNIEVRNAENKTVHIFTRKIDDNQKAPQTEDITLEKGTNSIMVYPQANGKAFTNLSSEITVNCFPCDEKETPFASQKVIFRSIVGLELSGASSAKNEQRPFLNFFFNTPLNFTRKAKSEGKSDKTVFGGFSVWGDIRLTTTPVQGIGSLADFTPAGFATNFVQGDSSTKVNDLVRSFDFLVGIEQQIIPPTKIFSGTFSGRTSLSFIASGGAITPLASDKTALYYKIPTVNNGMNLDPRFTALFTDIDFTDKKNVAFVTPDRDRFFRQYYGGFRLKTFFENKELKDFPAIFDVTFGQNEAITNTLKGVILRLDGSTPFPLSNADFLYLFGSVNMKLGRNVNQSIPPFFLEPATGVSLSGNDTAVISIDRSPFQTRNRDIFRIGVGINLFKLFEKKDDVSKK